MDIDEATQWLEYLQDITKTHSNENMLKVGIAAGVACEEVERLQRVEGEREGEIEDMLSLRKEDLQRLHERDAEIKNLRAEVERLSARTPLVGSIEAGTVKVIDGNVGTINMDDL